MKTNSRMSVGWFHCACVSVQVLAFMQWERHVCIGFHITRSTMSIIWSSKQSLWHTTSFNTSCTCACDYPILQDNMHVCISNTMLQDHGYCNTPACHQRTLL